MIKKMSKIIDLGMHPFADTFISKEQFKLSEPVYPLQCRLNKITGEIKVVVDTSDDERYNLYSYSYTSSNSKFSRSHWINYAKEVENKVKLDSKAKIVEIGSNDGFLARQFKKNDHDVLGIDASTEMAFYATEMGIETWPMIFNLKTSEIIKTRFGFADLVIANNVFNHSNDPVNFALGINNLLNDDGVLVYELPYWFNTIKDKKFDQIYHEHVTYFTVKYSYELLRSVGFEIIDAYINEYHGGSLRIYAKKAKQIQLHDHVKDMITKEEQFGLFDEEIYESFMQDLYDKRNKFMEKIYKIKSEGYSIVAVGAAAKGNTFLNFYNLDNTIIDYVTDSSEFKQGKYTPLTRIPIVGDEIFSEYDKVYALILSWNISDIIKENLKKINNNIEFLSP